MSRPKTRLDNANILKLGLFSANCAGGLAITSVPERWQPSWENNLTLARMAEAAGIEFLLPVARWTGYGTGASGYHDNVLETVTWATGLLAKTEAISVIATVHTAFVHPIVAAKQFITTDHIGGGGSGVNVVCGWNRLEYEMFGLNLPKEHAIRYALGQNPIIGDADTVADTLEAISHAGFDGATLSFVDYNAEFPHFRDEVPPRLERKGLRLPARS